MRALLFLQAFIICSQAQTWCGEPECPARPKCTNAELDLIIALDQSCSMDLVSFNKEKAFSQALTREAELKFNVSRFAGITFGHADKSPNNMRSKIFYQMNGGAAAFDSTMPVYSTNNNFLNNCGGTPTDEAFLLFANELNRTRKAGRMQVAVLLTDGIPTFCYTTDTATDQCSGQAVLSNTIKATRAADLERNRILPKMGTVVVTVGIGPSLTNNSGYSYPNTSQTLNGQQLLLGWASAPQFALLATNFNTLVTDTLQQVLDLLCFYVIDIVTPPQSSCYSAGTLFTIRGYNIFPMSTPPKCRWNKVGTQDFIYTDAVITLTNETFASEIGTVGYMSCRAPSPLPSDPFNAVLEISRDGVFFSSNEYSLLLRNDCSQAVCPNASLVQVFETCSMEELQAKRCSSVCRRAADSLAYDFGAYGTQASFTEEKMRACLRSSSLSQEQQDLVLGGKGNPCISAPFSTQSSASACVASLLFLVIGIFVSS